MVGTVGVMEVGMIAGYGDEGRELARRHAFTAPTASGMSATKSGFEVR